MLLDEDRAEYHAIVGDALERMIAKSHSTKPVTENKKDDPHQFVELWQQMVEMGISGLAIDEAHGGSGGSLTARLPCSPNSPSISSLISQGRPLAGSITEPSELTAIADCREQRGGGQQRGEAVHSSSPRASAICVWKYGDVGSSSTTPTEWL